METYQELYNYIQEQREIAGESDERTDHRYTLSIRPEMVWEYKDYLPYKQNWTGKWIASLGEIREIADTPEKALDYLMKKIAYAKWSRL